MKKIWFDEAWEEYLYWQMQDKKKLRRINLVLKEIERSRFDGLGKPEPLKGELSGFWSRRIDGTHRLVYRIRNEILEILSCRGITITEQQRMQTGMYGKRRAFEHEIARMRVLHFPTLLKEPVHVDGTDAVNLPHFTNLTHSCRFSRHPFF